MGVESRRDVIIGFHFILMPGSHHNRRDSESPVGVASTEPGAGLRGSAAPRWHVLMLRSLVGFPGARSPWLLSVAPLGPRRIVLLPSCPGGPGAESPWLFTIAPSGARNDSATSKLARRVSVGTQTRRLRGSAMPGVEHGRGINDTNPESERRRQNEGAKNPPVRSCPELRKCTNEPGASGGKKCITRFIYSDSIENRERTGT